MTNTILFLYIYYGRVPWHIRGLGCESTKTASSDHQKTIRQQRAVQGISMNCLGDH